MDHLAFVGITRGAEVVCNDATNDRLSVRDADLPPGMNAISILDYPEKEHLTIFVSRHLAGIQISEIVKNIILDNII